MNKQELFDTVARHLLTQNKRSMNAAGDTCVYRAPDGSKCAIGCLIPDDEYDPKFEGQTVYKLCKSGQYAPDWSKRHGYFCIRLQYVHDCVSPARWRDALSNLAEKHGLSTAVVDKWEVTSK